MDLQNRNIGIDGLRGICILYIVGFWHMIEYAQMTHIYINIFTYRLTWIVLGTFVLMSGYFMGGKKVPLAKKGLVSFYFNRFFRIYPLYLLSIILYTLLGLSDLTTSAKAALMISIFVKPAPMTLWFIPMLMFFYLISPFLIIVCRIFNPFKLVALYAILFILLMTYWYFSRLFDVRFLMYLPVYAFGIAMGSKVIDVNGKNKSIFFFLVLGTAVSLLTDSTHRSMNWVFATLLVTIAPFYLFSFFKKTNGPPNGWSRAAWRLSYASYCMFLFHRPIYILLTQLYSPESGGFRVIYLACFCVPCIGLLCYGIQRCYDMALAGFGPEPYSLRGLKLRLSDAGFETPENKIPHH